MKTTIATHKVDNYRKIGLTITYFYLIIILYLCTRIWFTSLPSRKVIKRESGENPEQSRCCKLLLMINYQ